MNINELGRDAGVLICGHGSRANIAEREFGLLARGLRQRFPDLTIEYGFLEYSAPNIHMALDRLRERGVNKIYAVPGMLFAATHAKNDIPSVLTTYQQKHPGLTIRYGRELGLHPEMIQAFQARILEAATGSTATPADGKLYDTLLVTVGRGTSVTEANAEAAKLTRIVCENLGFGWAETVYSGVTWPSVGRGLEMIAKLGFQKIVVAPYFLFGGRLVDRIHGYVDKVAADNPDITFVKVDYLRDQSHVINTFIERITETIGDDPENTRNSLCLMRDFQERLARGEVDVHHHHAEFQPNTKELQSNTKELQPENKDPLDEAAGSTCSHSHSHGHDHSHGHYKHIGHPHGPRTMINDNICCCFMGQFPQAVIDAEKAIKKERPGAPRCRRN